MAFETQLGFLEGIWDLRLLCWDSGIGCGMARFIGGIQAPQVLLTDTTAGMPSHELGQFDVLIPTSRVNFLRLHRLSLGSLDFGQSDRSLLGLVYRHLPVMRGPKRPCQYYSIYLRS